LGLPRKKLKTPLGGKPVPRARIEDTRPGNSQVEKKKKGPEGRGKLGQKPKDSKLVTANKTHRQDTGMGKRKSPARRQRKAHGAKEERVERGQWRESRRKTQKCAHSLDIQTQASRKVRRKSAKTDPASLRGVAGWGTGGSPKNTTNMPQKDAKGGGGGLMQEVRGKTDNAGVYAGNERLQLHGNQKKFERLKKRPGHHGIGSCRTTKKKHRGMRR